MKIILFILLTLSFVYGKNHMATILETLNSGGYTYMKVQGGKDAYWIAMTQRDVKVNDRISFSEQGWMKDFYSKTLNRTFESILFAADTQNQTIETIKNTKPDILDSKYKEKGTITVAELIKNRDKYVGKTVVIKGIVEKTSTGIIKRNWVHIADGSRFYNIDYIVFTTTKNTPKSGDIVYAKGIVEKDVDFGYGYFYPVIVQNSSFEN